MDEYLENRKPDKNAFTAGKDFYKLIKSQKFSLPNPIMKYLWEYPSDPEGYEKLIQSCKFFFAKNPILICPSTFRFERNTEIWYWSYCSKYHECFFNHLQCFRKKIILEKIGCRFWLISKLDIRSVNFPKNLLPKLYRSDAKQISLHSNINYLSDVRLLASSAVELSLAGSILDDNGQQILVEDFIESFPMLQKFCIYWNEKRIATCKNYEKVLTSLQKLPAFRKLIFQSLPDNFNIQTFLTCVKYLKIQFKTDLVYMNEDSPELDDYLAGFVDQLLEIKLFDYCPTYIWSYNLEKQKPLKYFSLCDKIKEYFKQK